MVTVTTEVAVNAPTAATIVAVPVLTPVTTPLVTVATDGFDDDQTTSPTAPVGINVGVIVCVSPSKREN